MPRYWIISANVNNKSHSTLQPWIRTILLNESAYMGWSNEDPKGKIFAHIAPDDRVLIAYGPMTNHGANRRLVACGRVKKNQAKEDPRVPGLQHRQFMQLHPFVSLNEDPSENGISLMGTPFDGNNQPSAVFELRRDDPKRVGNSKLCDWLDKRLGKTQIKSPASKRASPLVTVNTVRAGTLANAESHQYETEKQVIEAIHREQQLVDAYQRLLRKKGGDPDRRRYKTSEDVLYCDLYEPQRKQLIEAKASTRREHIRMAIGQLLDYANLSKAAGLGTPKLAVLLPSRPSMDVERLLDSQGIACIWRNGGSFKDNRSGRFL
jgi:hypothetical protein